MEAMGVADLDKAFLGHGSAPRHALARAKAPAPAAPTAKLAVQEMKFASVKAPLPVSVANATTSVVRAVTPVPVDSSVSPKTAPAPKTVYEQKKPKSKMVTMASEAMNSRFSDMFKAFQYVDLDRSGRLGKEEIRRALDMWNIPIDDAKLDELIHACDEDGDGNLSYAEFVDALARDTVNPGAMGKRGMQAMEAMGVADLDKAFLGHGSAPKHALAQHNM